MASIIERIDLGRASTLMGVLIGLTAPSSQLSGHIELGTRHGMGGFGAETILYSSSEFPVEIF